MDSLNLYKEYEYLISNAQEAAEKAYAPYSGFKVGAIIQTRDSNIIAGCNVENISFGLSICAERVALTKAISESYLENDEIEAIAVWGGKDGYVEPCGACRQFISEFCKPNTLIILKGKIFKFSELFPYPPQINLE